MHEGERLQKKKDGLVCVKKAIEYFGKGLRLSEVATLLGVSGDTLRARLKSLGIYEKAVSGDLWWELPSTQNKKAKKAPVDTEYERKQYEGAQYEPSRFFGRTHCG